MAVFFDGTTLLPLDPSLLAEPSKETVHARKALFPDLCLRCMSTTFSPLAWAHLRGDTVSQAIPDDATQDYHIDYGQDYVYQKWITRGSAKRRGPVLNVKVDAQEIVQLREESCQFCAFLARLDGRSALGHDPAHSWKVSMQLVWPDKASGIVMPMALVVELKTDEASASEKWTLLSFIDQESTYLLLVRRELYSFDEGITQHENSEQPPEPSYEAALGGLLSEARAWLQQCDQTHEHCTHAGNHRLPARLLDLAEYNNKKKVRLVETRSLSGGEYAVLSYVWGVAETLTLVQSTYAKLVAGLHVRDFPRTLIHAVKCVSFLDIRYLWVDALCILQDSQEDKSQEIPRMHEYYRSASVVISASGATDVHSGFLESQITEHQICAAVARTKLVRIPAYLADRSTTLLINGYVPLYQFSKEPVNRRAWCLQESVLPRRLITFPSTGGLLLRCLAGEKCAGQMISSPRDELPACLTLGSIAKARGIDKISSTWCELVQDYTRRSLTYQSDVLVGIGALAREFHHEHGNALGQYIAGIWEKDARNGLLWLTSEAPGSRSPMLPRNSGGPHAPSWSWASVPSKVSFHTKPETYIKSDYSGKESWERSFRPRWYCEILSHHITLKSELDPFGAVKEGSLSIQALLRRLHKHDEAVKDREAGLYAGELFLQISPDDRDVEIETLYLDPGSSLVWAKDQCYHWLGLWYAGRGRARGLIVEQVGEDAKLQFRRIGLAVFHVGKDDFPDADLHQEAVITLV